MAKIRIGTPISRIKRALKSNPLSAHFSLDMLRTDFDPYCKKKIREQIRNQTGRNRYQKKREQIDLKPNNERQSVMLLYYLMNYIVCNSADHLMLQRQDTTIFLASVQLVELKKVGTIMHCSQGHWQQIKNISSCGKKGKFTDSISMRMVNKKAT